jgi:DNA-binding LacI/PurR family transcriptional regulator
MATIKDVAAKAGVSTATVSHVVNGSRAVSVETKKKVKAAIKALKYRPDGIARSLRVAQTGTIAVLIADVTNPFFADFVRGVEDTAHQRGERYNLLLCNTEETRRAKSGHSTSCWNDASTASSWRPPAAMRSCSPTSPKADCRWSLATAS